MQSQALPLSHKSHDAVLLVLACGALMLEVGILFLQLRLLPLPTFLSRSSSTASVGDVVRKAHSVQLRGAGSLSWYPLAEGDAVLENDIVMTGGGSTAVIHLNEGGEIALEPYTLLRFPEKSRAGSALLALEVNRGIVKVRSGTEAVRVALQNRAVELAPRSEVLVSGSAENASIEVVEGTAQIDAGTLKAGQAASLGAASEPLTVVSRLALRTRIPAPGGQVFLTGDKTPVEFSWEGEKVQWVEWDYSAEMLSARRLTATGDRAQTELPVGKYYWRVAREGAVSAVSDFSVLPAARFAAQVPVEMAKSKEGRAVVLAWPSVLEAEGYVLELSPDTSFEKLERRLTLREHSVELEPLPAGKFFWRVKATHSFLGDWPYSPAYALQVRKRIQAPKVQGAKVVPLKKTKPEPKKGRSGSISKWKVFASFWMPTAFAAEVDKIRLEFTWDPTPGAKAYRLEVSTRRDFKRKLASTEGVRTEAILEVPEHTKYYWRVAAIDEDGDLGEFTPPQKIQGETLAKARVLDRSPTALPAAPAVPVVVVEKVRDEAPEPARARAVRAWIGYGGSYVLQNTNGAGYTAQSSGLPLHRLVGGWSHDFQFTTLEAHAWLQPIAYKSGATTLYQTAQWGADLFWSRVFLRRSIPLGFGLRVRDESRIASISNSGAGFQSTVFTALLLGTTWRREGRFPWAASAALEVAPLGTRTGLGLVLRNRLGSPWVVGGLKPSLEILAQPLYRAYAGTSELGFEVSASVVFEWADSLPTIGVRAL